MNENKNSENQNYLSGFDSVEPTPNKKSENVFNPTPMFSGMQSGTPNKPAENTPAPTPKVAPTFKESAPNVATPQPPVDVPKPSVAAPKPPVSATPTPDVEKKVDEPASSPEPKAAASTTPPASAPVAPASTPTTAPNSSASGTIPPKAATTTAKTEPPAFVPSGTYSYSANKVANDTAIPPVSDIPQNAPKVQTYTPPVVPINLQPEALSDKKKKKEKKPKKYGAGVIVLSVILAAIIGAGGGVLGVFFAQKYFDDEKEASSASDEKNQDVTAEENQNNTPQNITNIQVDETVNSSVEAVAKKAGPSIVGIRTTAAVVDFFGGSTEATGEGSGIIYSADGYIITNYHVIESAVKSGKSKVEVFLADDTETAIQATVVGYNIASDLAVVKVNKKGLPAIEFADSDKLKVGQYAIAIGNPGGLEFIGSVSYGVISGLNRSVAVGTGNAMSLIQTDAAINPGNSGGALVDISGKLIGVNSVKLVSTGYEGMGFAIPSNTVKEICNNIIDKQYEPTPYIGVEISTNYTADQLRAFGYPAGAVVVSVAPGSPADVSQIQRGDIITEFNGTTINDFNELENAIAQCKPGDSVTVKIFRAGRFYSSHINVAANTAQ